MKTNQRLLVSLLLLRPRTFLVMFSGCWTSSCAWNTWPPYTSVSKESADSVILWAMSQVARKCCCTQSRRSHASQVPGTIRTNQMFCSLLRGQCSLRAQPCTSYAIRQRTILPVPRYSSRVREPIPARPLRLIEALVLPRVGGITVTGTFPESRRVPGGHLDGFQPLGALVEVTVRDERANGCTVLPG
jgi:hypothetical protein